MHVKRGRGPCTAPLVDVHEWHLQEASMDGIHVCHHSLSCMPVDMAVIHERRSRMLFMAVIRGPWMSSKDVIH